MEVTFVVVMVIIFLFRNKAKSFAILVRVVDPVPDSANLVFKLYSSETIQTR